MLPKLCYYLFGGSFYHYLVWIFAGIVLYKPVSRLIKRDFFPILLISIPSILYFGKYLNDYFFFSDDLAHFNLVSHNSYFQIVKQALSSGGIWVGHKIILGFWLFKALFDFFGLNTGVFVFVIFVLNLVNVFLLYFVLAKFKIKRGISILFSFLFGNLYLYWVSNIHELLAGFFVLGSLYFWLSLIKTNKNKYLAFSTLFYIFAFLSKEIAFLLPFALFAATVVYNNLVKQIKIKHYLKKLLIMFSVLIIYSLIGASGFLNYFGIEKGLGYSMSFSLKVIYENLLHYITVLLPIINYSWVGLLLIILAFGIFDYFNKKLLTMPLFLIFLMFLGPALLFNARQAPYYLYIPSFFLFIAFSILFNRLKLFSRNRIIGIFLVIFLLFEVFNVDKNMMDSCFLIQYPQKKVVEYEIQK